MAHCRGKPGRAQERSIGRVRTIFDEQGGGQLDCRRARLVRVERYKGLPKSSKIHDGNDTDDNADSNLSEEDPIHNEPERRKLGRASCDRYGCVGEYSKRWSQGIAADEERAKRLHEPS
ncbi:unnamed protein product [Ascophyllum nodosum]